MGRISFCVHIFLYEICLVLRDTEIFILELVNTEFQKLRGGPHLSWSKIIIVTIVWIVCVWGSWPQCEHNMLET